MGEVLVCELDVRWEGWTHEEIDDRVRKGCGAAVTERLEGRLTSTAAALDEISDLVNTALQRVDGGDWAGGAASAVSAVMRVVRDFDDVLGHHGKVNTLAAYGQSDNAGWARANVPPYVDVRAAQVPTGTPLDAVNATADHQHQVQAARDAEERARQVMRTYQAMTTARIAALPPLSPAPRLVVATSDSLTVPPDGNGHVAPADGSTGGPGHRTSPPEPGTARKPRIPAGTPGEANGPAAPPPSGAAGAATGSSPVEPPPGERATTNTEGTTRASAVGGVGARPGADGPLPGPDVIRRDGGHAGAGPRDADPGGRGLGAHPGAGPLRAGGRGGVADVLGRATRGEPFGVAPGGARKAEEDGERRGRYAVPGSEIFEPDNDDGLLHDPFRPGSYVAPASIGDEDE